MLKVTIFARLLVFLCLDVDLMAAYIQNGRCYFNKPYTTKIVSAIRSCTRDCKINKACQAVVFDRYKKLCNFYDNQYDIKECPGKYLVLRNDIEEDQSQACTTTGCPETDCGPIRKSRFLSTVKGNQVTSGSVVKYTCTLDNNVTYVTCQDDGQWSDVPTCMPKLTNLALRKMTSQTDTSIYAYSSRAVDGNTSQEFAEKSCTHTRSVNATWEVDLENVVAIDHVVIYNRIDDCCMERLQNVQIFTSKDQMLYTLVAFQPGNAGSILILRLKEVAFGRWLMVTRSPPHEELTLCEVEVMGYDYTKHGIPIS